MRNLTRISVISALFPIIGLSDVISYDLKDNWSNSGNPNGAWSYRQGSTDLPYQPSLSTIGVAGITGGYAPSNRGGGFLPAFFQATGNGPYGAPYGYEAGDIVVHSTDNTNGNASLGPANFAWTSPGAGTVTFFGSIWFAQPTTGRSNDFALVDTATNLILASGTIAETNGSSRDNPTLFAGAGPLSVSAGDVIELLVTQTDGQAYGSFAGVNLKFIETTSGDTNPPATIPEPAALTSFLLGGGFLLTARIRRRRSA
jgi:hypothetical protein